MPNYIGNPPRNKLAKMCKAATAENRAPTTQCLPKIKAINMRPAVMRTPDTFGQTTQLICQKLKGWALFPRR